MKITKDQFVALLDTVGITDAQKQAFHAVFEQRHPEAHENFLADLGVRPPDIAQLRARARLG